MILYHGTTQIIGEIDLTKGRLRTDFGKGFYLGNNLEVAEKWAISRAAFSGTPIVMRYLLNSAVFSNKAVNYLTFDEPSVGGNNKNENDENVGFWRRIDHRHSRRF